MRILNDIYTWKEKYPAYAHVEDLRGKSDLIIWHGSESNTISRHPNPKRFQKRLPWDNLLGTNRQRHYRSWKHNSTYAPTIGKDITTIRRLGSVLKPNVDETGQESHATCRPLLVTTSNQRFLNSCFARSHYLQNYPTPVDVKKFLPQDDRRLEKELLAKRYEMVTTEGKNRNDFGIKNLKLYYKNELDEISTQWQCPRKCLLVNCQSICSFEKRYALTELCNINSVNLVVLTETWLYCEISIPEIFLGSSFNVIARHDQDRGIHGGCLIAQCTKDTLNVLDISIPAFKFAVSCVVFSDTPSFFVLVYNPPSSSAYSIDIEELVKCLDAYFRKFQEVLRQFVCGTILNIYLLGDFDFPSIDWNTYSSSIASECQFIDF